MENQEHIPSQAEIGRGVGNVNAKRIAGRDITELSIFQNVSLSEREKRLRQLNQRLASHTRHLEQALRNEARTQQPYPGLTPYTLESHRQFFGREQLAETLANRIAPPDGSPGKRLLILYGAPGVGKTSLVRAGLQPYLVQSGHLPFYIPIWRQSPTDAFYRLFATTYDAMPGKPGAESRAAASPEDLPSLQRQLDEARKNLRFIQERMADYVLSTDVPLQLEKDERRWLSTIALLERQIAQLVRFGPRQNDMGSAPEQSHLFFEDAELETPLCHILLWMTQATGKRLYLIFDQFEAFFGPHFDNRQRMSFIAQLGDCLQVGDLDAVFILVVRTEQYAGLNAFKRSIPTIFDSELEVPLLGKEGAREAIIRPLAQLPDQVLFSPDLVDLILDELDDQGIDPTQLQIICDTLWARWKSSNGALDVRSYQEVGGRKGILNQYLHSFLKRHIKPQYQDLSRAVLASLLSSEGKATAKTRRQLAHGLGDPPGLDGLLEDLNNLDLIYAEADAPDQMMYALSHRYLEQVITVDPDVVDRKRAEEMLEAGLREFGLRQFTLGEHAYQFIKRQVDRGTFRIPPEAAVLWRRSWQTSTLRHLVFRTLMAALFGSLLAVPALVVGVLETQLGITFGPLQEPQNIVFIGLSAALGGALFNGLGVAINTALEYKLPHWSRRKRFGPFLLAMGAIWGVGAVLLEPSEQTVFYNLLEALVGGCMIGLFAGVALYLSLPPEQKLGWWGKMRPSVITGPLFGLLLAITAVLTEGVLVQEMNALMEIAILCEFPVYIGVVTTTFAFGFEAGDRLLLGSPGSSYRV